MGCRPSKSTQSQAYGHREDPKPTAMTPSPLSPVQLASSRGTGQTDDPAWPFITRRDHVLYEGAKPFRFISFNVPSLLLIGDRPGVKGWTTPTPFEQRDALLSIRNLGGRVTRTYTLGIGPDYHITAPRTYNETCFVAMDHCLAIAREVGVRLIVPFVNQHWGDDSDDAPLDPTICTLGSYAMLSRMRGRRPSQFWTDPDVVEDVRHLVAHVLNRVNTVNGIRYGDDATVLCWQLGNELGGWHGSDPPTQWTMDMTALVRSLAPRTLVMDGSIGGMASEDRLDRTCLASPSGPDVFVQTYYHASDDVPRLARDADHIARRNRKAFIVSEHGLSNPDVYARTYDAMLANDLASGSLLWSLRFHSRDGGFYVHSEKDGSYWSYHDPGFPAAVVVGRRGFGQEEAVVLPLVRRYAMAIQGSDSATVPCPLPEPAPQLLPDVRPDGLRFRGSAGAASYLIWRGEEDGDGTTARWEQEPIASGVLDCVASGSVIWKDATAVRGKGYLYAVQAVGVSGARGPRSEPVGPVFLA
ncbi:hypothetical protein HKX48_007194 [Thoreauomyces humboldtii]|nr:hypothetical protein HKX48_007194 [Thoreauomyces humboldtii]